MGERTGEPWGGKVLFLKVNGSNMSSLFIIIHLTTHTHTHIHTHIYKTVAGKDRRQEETED